MNRLRSFLVTPYPLRNSMKGSLQVSVAVTLFIFFTQALMTTAQDELFSLLVFCTLIGAFVFVYLQGARLLFGSTYKNGNWRVAHQIIFVFILITLVGILSHAISTEIASLDFWEGVSKVIFIGIVLAIAITFFDYHTQLKINLGRTTELNHLILNHLHPTNQTRDFKIALNGSESREQVLVNLSDLQFVKASGNYLEIHTSTAKELLRSSMKEVENQLAVHKHIARCHRSYLVNLDKVKSSQGNSHGLTLLLEDLDCPIPVSRKYYRKLITSNYFDPNRKHLN